MEWSVSFMPQSTESDDSDDEFDNDSNVNLPSGLDQSIDNDFERKCVEWKKSESKVDLEKILCFFSKVNFKK